jgi:uncharacterized membrane protein YdjX (TVP38/TMEM64 family)
MSLQLSRLTVAVVGLVVVVTLAWFLPVTDWTIGLAERIRGAGATGLLIFIAIYVVAEVALVPGSLLTMAAGFAYGPIAGLLVASPASVLAATTAFVLGRTALREWVRKKVATSSHARALDRAIHHNSFKLILLLRLSPLLPFNVLNYILGAAGVPVGRYVIASFVGMLPGTWLYVYLGSLATTAAGIAHPEEGGGPARFTLTIGGLIATVLAVLFITRAARRMLDEELQRGDGDYTV